MSTKYYELDYTFPSDNGYVLLPVNREGKVFPVLYLLHGSGADGCEEWIRAGNIENNINKWVEENDFSPMIVVMPKNKRKSQGGFKDFVNQFSKVTDYIEKYYKDLICKGQEHTAIAGFSMGGAGTLYCAHVYKNKFKHIAAFSPSEFVHCNSKESWIPWEEEMKFSVMKESIIYIGYGDAEPNFERVAKRYIHELVEQGYVVNANGLKPKTAGGHNMGTFLELLKRFLMVDIFSNK